MRNHMRKKWLAPLLAAVALTAAQDGPAVRDARARLLAALGSGIDEQQGRLAVDAGTAAG
jgi:hypothetical protein